MRPSHPPRPRRLSRRLFLAGCGAAGAGALGAGAYAGFVAPFDVELRRVRMDFAGLPEALTGYRIVQISDLHVCDAMPVEFLAEQLGRCTRMEPDLIVVTGDFLTYGRPEQLDVAVDLMRQATARDGVLAVLGNHDYHLFPPGGSPRWGEAALSLAARLERVGVRVLRNEMVTIRRGGDALQLVGTDEFRHGYYDARAAFAGVDPRLPCVALQHNPDAAYDLAGRACRWILCGHTHGGQVRLPLVGPLWLPVRNRRFDAGLFDVNGARLYVNRGLGFIRRVRFNCPPEITEFTLTATG